MKLLWMLLLRSLLASASSEVLIFSTAGVVSTPGGNASFTCFLTEPPQGPVRVQWLMNGSAALLNETIEQGNAHTTMPFDNLWELDLINLSTQINISCSFLYSAENITSSPVSLNLQGLLSAVGSLVLTIQDSTISLNWTAPFTLDIPNVDPDITYCVGVVNSTSSTILLHSQCGITETEFNYTLPHDSPCHTYMFTVTPVNMVGNGELETLTLPQEEPTVMDVARVNVMHMNGTEVLIIMSAGVCHGEVTFEDLDTEEIITLGDEEFSIAKEHITIITKQLRVNRQYNITVVATNSRGSAISYANISTHDVIAAKIEASEISVTSYSEHSDARGALFAFMFIDDNGDVNFTRSVLLALDRNTSLNYTLPFNLYPGQYRVFVYDIESDGTLSNGVGYPAIMSELNITANSSEQVSNKNTLWCNISTTSGAISAECTFPMATGFQMIVQLSNSSEVHKLHVNQSMDLQTPVTVEVEESGVYLISIFAIVNELGILNESGIVMNSKYIAQYLVVNIVTYTMPMHVPTSGMSTFTSTTMKDTNSITGVRVVVVGGVTGTVFVFVVIMIVVVVVVVCCKRRRHKLVMPQHNIYSTDKLHGSGDDTTHNTPGVFTAPLTSGPPLYDAISALPGELHELKNIGTEKPIVECEIGSEQYSVPAIGANMNNDDSYDVLHAFNKGPRNKHIADSTSTEDPSRCGTGRGTTGMKPGNPKHKVHGLHTESADTADGLYSVLNQDCVSMKPLKIKAKHPPLLYEDILGEGTKPHSSVPSIRSHLPVTSSTPDTSHHEYSTVDLNKKRKDKMLATIEPDIDAPVVPKRDYKLWDETTDKDTTIPTIPEYAAIDPMKKRMMLAPTECKVTGLKSMYADVQHTTTSDVDTIDSNDVKYSAIAGTRSGPGFATEKVPVSINPIVSGVHVTESMYADVHVQHLESAAARNVVDVIDINDPQYSAIAGTRNKHSIKYEFVDVKKPSTVDYTCDDMSMDVNKVLYAAVRPHQVTDEVKDGQDPSSSVTSSTATTSQQECTSGGKKVPVKPRVPKRMHKHPI